VCSVVVAGVLVVVVAVAVVQLFVLSLGGSVEDRLDGGCALTVTGGNGRETEVTGAGFAELAVLQPRTLSEATAAKAAE
jgi:hypothetical protein